MLNKLDLQAIRVTNVSQLLAYWVFEKILELEINIAKIKTIIII